MFKRLIKLVKDIQGNVLTIGVDDQILNCFIKNDKVNVYTLNRAESFFERRKNKIKRDKSGKDINIKRLRKYFKKKSIDYMIVNYDEIKDYLKYVIRDIVYINSFKLYLYGNNIDIDLIKNRFTRYGAVVDITRYKESILFAVDNKNSKTNWIKDKVYYIKDTLYNIGEVISALLVN